MRIALAADHGGYDLKKELVAWLRLEGHDVLDLGAHSYDSGDDYPESAHALAQSVASGQCRRGILICGSGVGACVTANKVPSVRASVCHDCYSAHQGVEHDDMNVLCLGARVIGIELAKELVVAFLMAEFHGEERFKRRLGKLLDIERRYLRPM